MNDAILLWLFGIVGAWLCALSIAFGKMMLVQVKMQVAIDLYINTLGEKIAKALHNDDDHLGLDALLDKYLDPNYELSFSELVELKNRCAAIADHSDSSKLEKSLAGILTAVCEHTLKSKNWRSEVRQPG